MSRWWMSGALALSLSCLPLVGEAAGPAPLSSADTAVAELGKEVTDPSRPLAERIEIVRALGGWATAQVRPLLLIVLKDPAPELRAAAAQALGWPDNREAVAALRERIEAAGEVQAVKAEAIRSLGRIGDPSVRPLVVAATQSQDNGVREAALWSVALGALVDPADRTTYLLQLAADTAFGGQLRCDAIRVLADVKEDRVADVLIQILEREPRSAIALPKGQPTQQDIMALRYAQARDVAAWTASALGKLEVKRAVPLLLKAAEDREDYFLRLMSLQVLIVWGSPEGLPVFVRRLEDPLPDNRVMALLGLAKLGDRSVMPAVLPRLTDRAAPVRAQAVVTVSVLGEAAAVRPTLEALQKKETDANVLSALENVLSNLPR
jgi:HEAT repeat protein